MPFTLSHPAAVAPIWPLARRLRLPLAALAIGAMSPDFEFFLHLRPEARWSHSLGGLVAFCVPAALVIYLTWELWLRTPVRSLLGLPARPHPEAPAWRAPAWWSRVVLALLLGSATHLAWDGVTHGGYWGPERWPWLLAPAVTVFGRVIPWYNVLQHVSTVLGGLVVVGWLSVQLRRAGALRRLRRSRWRVRALGYIGACALVVGGWNAWRWGVPSDYWTVQIAAGRLAVGSLLGLGLAIVSFSTAFRIRRGGTPPAAA